MPDERCIHEMVVGTCALCAPREPDVTAEARQGDSPRFRHSGAIYALFVSTCGECRQTIYIGDPISKNPNGYYVHEECA